MSLRIQYEFLFVGRDEGTFVENYAYDLGDGGDQSGKIFINLEIQNNPAEAEIIGETIFDTVRKVFFADLDKEPYVRFEDALKAVNKALNILRNEKVSHFLGDLNVVIAAVVGSSLLLTQCGEAEAYLVRRRFCTTVTEGLQDPQSKDIFTNIASGTLEPKDFILLSSTNILRYIGKNDLAKVASGRNLVGVLGELKDFLMTEVLGRIGFVGIAALDLQPELSTSERGQIVAHLQKEEEYDRNGVVEKKSVQVFVTDLSKKVGGFVGNLSNRLRSRRTSSSASSLDGERVVRGNNGNGFGRWSKDQILGALIVLVLVLTVGIWWLKSKAEEQDKINAYMTTLNTVRDEIASAETTGQYNKDQAGQILNDAEQKALGVLNSGFHRAKANELLKQVQDERDKLDGVVRVTPKVLVDLAQQRPNVSALGLVGLKGILYAFEYNALYPILLDKVQTPITIDDNETVIAAVPFEDKGSLLFYTKAGKVLEFADNRFTFVPATEGAYHKGVAVQAYGNKLYILDTVANQIWKYTRRRDKFDTAEPYNIDGDVKKGLSFAIDGNIYILNSDGTFTKLFSGNKQDLPIKKAPIDPLMNPTKIYTKLEMNQIYVLEPQKHRVMVFFKDDRVGGLTYSVQYVFDELNDVRDLYVDQDAKRMYLVDQNKVYEVAL